MSTLSKNIAKKAHIDFHCLDSENCDGVVSFNLAEIADKEFQAVCPKCHRPYELAPELVSKLERLLNLVSAIRESADILGDCSVAVTVAGAKEVKIPYALLLTRLNTQITLDFGDRKVDFHLWIEPSSQDTFR